MTTSVGGTVCVRGAGVAVSPDTPGVGTAGTASTVIIIILFYYPLEVRRGKYWGWGVFLLQCFPLVKI